MTFNNILFPVDFSERSKAIVSYVRALATRHNAHLTLASFIETPAIWHDASDAPIVPELSISRLTEEAERRLTFFAAEHFPGIQSRIQVAPGDPGAGIVELADASSADLIMMPTRGRGRFRAALLGSVTAKVLHDAECPVWTAAHTETLEQTTSTEWHKIVCAIDTTDEAAGLIRDAAEIASQEGSHICLVHAVPAAAEAGQPQYFDRNFEVFLKDSARKTIGDMQHDAGTHFKICIGVGRVSAIIATSVLHQQADLVLVGRGTLPRFGGRLRTNLYSIIRDANCPVLTL